MERWVEWETNITIVTTDIRRYSQCTIRSYWAPQEPFQTTFSALPCSEGLWRQPHPRWNSLHAREKAFWSTCSSWVLKNSWFEGSWDKRHLQVNKKLQRYFFVFKHISTLLIYLYRNHGTRKSLRSYSHAGSLHAINLSMRWKDPSSLTWWNMATKQSRISLFPSKMVFKGEWWNSVKKLLTKEGFAVRFSFLFLF